VKITRSQLRKIILKEFKDTSRKFDIKGKFDIKDLIGSGGALPPAEPPESGGGGGGNGDGDTPCELNLGGRFDKSFEYTFQAFGTYLQAIAGTDEFTYVDRLLDKDLISLDDIANYGDINSFINEGLLYGISLALCEGRITKLDIDEAFKNPRNFV
jgi:hypothetical protein